MRAAIAEDVRRIWEWRSDPATRAASFTSDPIPYADHVQWFTRALASPAFRFVIAVDEAENPVGFVRFRLEGDEAEISVGIDPARRGEGYGAAAILAATRRLLRAGEAKRVRALVKAGNEASLRAFGRAGYELRHRREVRGSDAYELIYRPSEP